MKYLKRLEDWLTEPDNQGWIVVAVVLIVLLASVILANARTIGYGTPNENDWYSTLMQPDAPQSCCGAGDAYYADETAEGPGGQTIAIITDTRPDQRTLPNGNKIFRAHIPVGTKVPIPPEKIRKHPVFNPTGHTIIFVGTGGWVYCYEPQPLI